MKPPDRIFQDAATLGMMVKVWIGLVVAIVIATVLVNASLDSLSGLPDLLLIPFIIVVGGRILISLVGMLRRNQDRIALAAPWLFDPDDVRQAKKRASLGNDRR